MKLPPADAARTRKVRFGVFEFDAQSSELRKRGLRVRLLGQPVRILAMLLDRPGELVTREEIQKALWPEDTFVNFEHSLNAAMKRLRRALGDSPGNPRFVETLPRRGYRFIAPTELPRPRPRELRRPTPTTRWLSCRLRTQPPIPRPNISATASRKASLIPSRGFRASA